MVALTRGILRGAPVPEPRIRLSRPTRCYSDSCIPLPRQAGFYYPNQSDSLYGPGWTMPKIRNHNCDAGSLTQVRPKGHALKKAERQHAQLIVFEGGRQLAELIVYGTPLEPGVQPCQDIEFVYLFPMTSAPASLPPASSSDAESDWHKEEELKPWAEGSNLFVKEQASPRRTLRLKFVCNICGVSNVNSVNPFAWRHGTVLMDCGNCGVRHKMVDHLKLFHEMRGQVFQHKSASHMEELRRMMPTHLLPNIED